MRKLKLLCASLLALCMVFAIGFYSSGKVNADVTIEIEIDLSKLDSFISNDYYNYDSRTEVLTLKKGNFYITTNMYVMNGKKIVVRGDKTNCEKINITMENLMISMPEYSLCPFEIDAYNTSDVEICVKGTNRLIAGDTHAALEKNDYNNSWLTFTGDGYLYACGGNNGGAGIGTAKDARSAANIIFDGKGLQINAEGYNGAAGIGGGANSGLSNCAVYAGKISATAKYGKNPRGAGIGNGASVSSNVTGANVRIYGGFVTVSGYHGLGSAESNSGYSNSSSIYMFDGTLKTTESDFYSIDEIYGGSIIDVSGMIENPLVRISGLAKNSNLTPSYIDGKYIGNTHLNQNSVYSLEDVTTDSNGNLFVALSSDTPDRTVRPLSSTSKNAQKIDISKLNFVGRNASGSGWSYNASTNVLTITGEAGSYRLTSEMNCRTSVVINSKKSVTSKLTVVFEDLRLVSPPQGSNVPVTVASTNTSDINIVLEGENVISALNNKTASILKTNDTSTLSFSGDGILCAYATGGAAIGTSNNSGDTACNIVINSGYYELYCQDGAAAIGGGKNCGSSNITINGGHFDINTDYNNAGLSGTAVGAGAAINNYTSALSTTINGGYFMSVNAYTLIADSKAANGYECSFLNANINGGTFYAKVATHSSSYPITVTGGVFTFQSGSVPYAKNANGSKLVYAEFYGVAGDVVNNHWYMRPGYTVVSDTIKGFNHLPYSFTDSYVDGGRIGVLITSTDKNVMNITVNSPLCGDLTDEDNDGQVDTLTIHGNGVISNIDVPDTIKLNPINVVLGDDITGIDGRVFDFGRVQYISVKCTSPALNTIKTYYPDRVQVRHNPVTSATISPTCTSVGYTNGKECADCGAKISSGITIPKLDHKLEEFPKVDATCTEDGHYAGQRCVMCGLTYGGTSIPAKGHDLVEFPFEDATCTQAGHYAGQKCTRCDLKYGGVVINPKGHDVVAYDLKSATCTADGHVGGSYCSRCNNEITPWTVVPKTGHKPVALATIPATCEEDGSQGGTKCEYCGAITSLATTIPAKGHRYVEDPAIAPTATTPGRTQGYHCGDCGLVLIEPTVIPATGELDDQEIRDFVKRLYTCVLERAYDPDGYEMWTGLLKRHEWNGGDVAYGFFFSPELVEKNITDEDFITRLYKTFLDRNPDAEGLATWKQYMADGHTRYETFMGFVNSEEWDKLCASYGILSGNTNSLSGDVRGFATRLYATCLGRRPDDSGVQTWISELTSKRMTGSEVARGFFFSDEFMSKNCSDKLYVERLYATLMGRTPDKTGLETWVGALSSGKMSRQEVFEGFANSAEFATICAAYGINV